MLEGVLGADRCKAKGLLLKPLQRRARCKVRGLAARARTHDMSSIGDVSGGGADVRLF